MRRVLFIATANPGKIRELKRLLPASIVLLTLIDIGMESPEETGTTLRENADLKARVAARSTGFLSIADDSGLEVEALGGAPGVRSARFAGEPPDDARNRREVLNALSSVPTDQRAARFVSAVTIASPAGVIWTSEGTLHGTILDHERGTGGFGYDSIFVLPDGRTLAELLDEEKNAMSHRAAAIRAILPSLRDAITSFDASSKPTR